MDTRVPRARVSSPVGDDIGRASLDGEAEAVGVPDGAGDTDGEFVSAPGDESLVPQPAAAMTINTMGTLRRRTMGTTMTRQRRVLKYPLSGRYAALGTTTV